MYRPILVSTLAAALCAGDAVPAAPVITLAVADGPVLLQHCEQSLYGAVWQDPGLAWVRQQWDTAKAGLRQTQGLDIDAILRSASGVRAEYLGMGLDVMPRPRIRAEVDLAAQAKPVYDLAVASALAEAVAVPGANEARRLSTAGPVLARHGTRLVLGWNCDAVPWPVTPIPGDARLVMDYRSLMAAMSQMSSRKPEAPAGGLTNQPASDPRILDLLGTISWDTSLVPQGLHEVMLYDKPSPGVMPVDRALLDRFPASAIAVAGMGLDLAALWRIAGPAWLASLDGSMHPGGPKGAEATRAEVDALLAGLGVVGGVDRLMQGVHGTIAVAVTPGTPMPGLTVVLPRSVEIDALVGAGLARLQATAPAEGATAVVPVPNLPVLISIGRDKTHWIVSSDAVLIDAWMSGQPGGFLASPAGAAVVAAAPATAYALGALDTASAMRMLLPFVSMGLGQARGMPPEGKQAIMAGLARLIRDSGPTWAWSASEPGRLRTEAHGPIGLGVMPLAMIAAIAVPNLLESRVTANEHAAAAMLKSGIFPAEVQFQGGGYMDQDADLVGEYGTLAELSGRVQVRGLQLHLVAGPLSTVDVSSGYHFRIDLPDAQGGAIPPLPLARQPVKADADAQERGWIVYAWPQSRDTGRTVFALGIDGQVRALPWDGTEPAWSSALGNGWTQPPTWPAWSGMHTDPQLRAPQRAPARSPEPAAF